MDLSTLPDRVPPQSLEAEQATLGAMLLDRDAIARAVELLRPQDFYREAHERLFHTMMTLFDRGDPVDLVTLGEQLKSQGDLDRVGGIPYLTELLERVPTAANVERYASIVRDKAILRNLIQASSEMIRLAHDTSEDVDKTVDECERRIFAVAERTVSSSFTSLRDLVSQAFDRIELIQKTREPGTGIHTGFQELDSLTTGLQPSDLIVIAARPSVGKTALALNIAVNIATRQDSPVAIFSLEMAKEQLAMRLLCSEARVDMQSLRHGYLGDDDLPKIMQAVEKLYKAPIFIDDTPAMTVLEMRGKARRLSADQGALGVVVVDYLQLVHSYGRSENRTQEIAEVARSLKSMARELRAPVIACAQLSRAVETRGQIKRPLLSDLRESGSIEAEADVVAFIYRPMYYGIEELQRANYSEDEPNVAEIIVAKQRNGPTGTVKLAWLAPFARFEELEETYEET